MSILVESHKQSGEADFQRSNQMKKRWRGLTQHSRASVPGIPATISPQLLRSGHCRAPEHGAWCTYCSGGAGGKWWLDGPAGATPCCRRCSSTVPGWWGVPSQRHVLWQYMKSGGIIVHTLPTFHSFQKFFFVFVCVF